MKIGRNTKTRATNPGEADLLGLAIQATRQAARRSDGVGRFELSPESRARVVEAAHRQSEKGLEPLPAVFAAPRRLLAAGAVPLLLAAGLLVLLNRPFQTPPIEVASRAVATQVHVSKQGDQVFFQIANGQRQHRVLRSTSPDRFDPASAVSVRDGSYVDSLDDASSLVFYRID